MEDKVIFNVEIPKEDITSIENLTKANKELREERKKLDLQSAEGQKRAQQINRQLDENTEIIKKNSSALEKQRLNIGNYSSALDKVLPGLSGATTGIQGMTTASLQFLATPIGIVIGALGLALGAVMSYLKGTEEGQHRLNAVMNVGSAVLGQVTTAIQFLGEVIVDSFIKAFETMGDILAYIIPGFDGLTASINNFLNLDTANTLSDLQEQEVVLNRLLIVERGRLRRQIEEAKLRSESTKDLDERKAALLEVERLTNELADKEVRLLEIRRDIEIESSGLANNKIEDNDKIAESVAAIEDAEAKRAAALKENETKLLAIREQEKVMAAADVADARARQRAASETRNADQVEIETLHKQTMLTIETTFGESVLGVRNAIRKKNEEGDKKALKAKKEVLSLEVQSQMAALGALSGLLGAFRSRNKAAAAGEALINTFLGVTRILQAPTAPFVEPFASITRGIQIAATLASGFNAIRQINSATFATGGLTGQRITGRDGVPIKRPNGDNLLATVKTGEVILNERQQAALGGARTFRRIGVPGFFGGGSTGLTAVAQQSESRAQQRQLYDAIANIRPVVFVSDITSVQNSVEAIENKAMLI